MRRQPDLHILAEAAGLDQDITAHIGRRAFTASLIRGGTELTCRYGGQCPVSSDLGRTCLGAGRFPRGRGELSDEVTAQVTDQVGVPAADLGFSDWAGRSAKYHRAQIRWFLAPAGRATRRGSRTG